MVFSSISYSSRYFNLIRCFGFTIPWWSFLTLQDVSCCFITLIYRYLSYLSPFIMLHQFLLCCDLSRQEIWKIRGNKGQIKIEYWITNNRCKVATRKQKISCRSSQRNIEESRRDSKFWGFIGPCGKVTRRCVTSWSTRQATGNNWNPCIVRDCWASWMLYVNYMCFIKGLVEFDSISCAWIQEGEGNEDLASIWPWDNLRSCWQDVSVETPYSIELEILIE